MNRESLSALLDGECSGAELDRLLDALDREPALKSEWSRLCRTRDSGFTARVMSAIQADARPRARVFAFPARTVRVLQPLAGYALAASIGAFTVFSLMPAASTPAPVLVPVQSVAYVAQAPATEAEPDPQLNSYLMNYSHARARQGVGGALGYARVAAHNAVYRPGEGGN